MRIVAGSFQAGRYPFGLTWSSDGTQLVFSLGTQAQEGGGFPLAAVPGTAALFAVNTSTGAAVPLPNGVSGGFLPNLPAVGGTGNPIDLSSIPLSFTKTPDGGFLFRASGLNPNTSYRFESSTSLRTFPEGQNFTGQVIMNGIAIGPQTIPRKYFRIRELP